MYYANSSIKVENLVESENAIALFLHSNIILLSNFYVEQYKLK